MKIFVRAEIDSFMVKDYSESNLLSLSKFNEDTRKTEILDAYNIESTDLQRYVAPCNV